ncbi:MAG: glycerate kinase, partial [Pauljensenia sp.]
MVARVLVVGHWDRPAFASAGHALGLVGEGLVDARPGTRVDTIPFGTGEDFEESLRAAPPHALAPVVVGVEEETTRRAGREVLAAWGAGLTPVLEGGHNIDVDAGLGFLEELSGQAVSRDASLEGSAQAALEIARESLAGRDLIAAASTARPLLGLSSVVATGIDLGPRAHQDRAHTAALARFFGGAGTVRPALALADVPVRPDPSRLPGSGSAGGAAAMVAALGGRIVPTGMLLTQAWDLGGWCGECDLVVVLEPVLHSPHLADALLDSVTDSAALHALPVVAVGRETSLSTHEAAQWG